MMFSSVSSYFTFSNLCRFHAGIDFLTGSAILYSVHRLASLTQGTEQGQELLNKLEEEKNKDKMAIRVTESLVGLLLVDVGILLSVISTTTQEELQSLTCKAALGMHSLMIGWRLIFQKQVDAVSKEVPGQIIGDVVMASTWAAFLYLTLRKQQ